jgi:Secretion system C-terminal sorting domain
MMKNLLFLTFMTISFLSVGQCNINISWTSSVSGGNITFTNTSAGVPSNPAFAWLYDGQSSSVENPTFPYDSLVSQVCFAIYDLDSSACQDSICGPMNNPPCALNISWTSVLNAGNITFTNTSTGVPTNPAFAWLYDGQSSSQENPTFPYDSTAGQVCFAIYDIDTPSCQDSICGGVNLDTTGCNLAISWLSSVSGGNITFYNTSAGTPSNPSFAWLYNGQSSSSQNPTFPYDSTASQVCFAIYDLNTPSCQDSICGGLNMDSTANTVKEEQVIFKLYPNPASSEINIALDNAISSYTMQILDYTGRLVYSQILVGNSETIDVSGLNQGGYLLYLIDSESGIRLAVQKFLKQ